MTHSPGDVVRWLLVQLGQGSDPTAVSLGLWPAYESGEPSTPDNCLTLTDTAGMSDGRSMVDGIPEAHYGFQVRVRAVDSPTGRAKADAIRTALAQVYDSQVSIGNSTYVVYAVARIGQVMDIGKDTPRTKRSLFTLNATAAIRQLS